MYTFYFFNWHTGKHITVKCADRSESWGKLRAKVKSQADDYEGPFDSMAKLNDWIIRMRKLAAEF